MESTRELHQRLEGLSIAHQHRAADVGAAEAEIKQLDHAEQSHALPPAVAKRRANLRENLPRERQAAADLVAAIEQTKKALAARREVARKQPMTDGDRKRYELGIAYADACAAVETAAVDMAKKSRAAFAAGEAFARGSGNEAALRLFFFGHFKARLNPGIVRLFERDPAAPGAWGGPNSLLDLGDSKRNGEIARRGFADYERALVRDILGSELGDAI